ncbi:PEPxxWA-CTERM sorting domain-containing protein [Sphingosinicellaceae bacterium]|nr:PEPxxWA-CTERM sorting domain-containing protein [Sphingosinicellaceae bacterium]
MNFRGLLAATALLIGAAAAPAQAVTIWYDEAAFDAATSGLTNYGFPGGTESTNVAPFYQVGPVFFAADSLSLFDDGAFGPGQTYIASPLDLAAIIFGGSSIGFHIGSYCEPDGEISCAQDVAITVNDDFLGLLSTGDHGALSFIGFTDLEPLSGILFSPEFGEIDITDFKTDAIGLGAVPEPTTWALLITGFGAVGTALRRRRRGHVIA